MRSAKEKTVARPKANEPRCHQLNLSLSASELASIRKRASALGMRTAHFGRAMLLEREGRATKHEAENNHEQLIYGQLVRLGNNLNQLVRHLHRTGDPLPADLEPLLTDIRQIITREARDDH
jgi:Bacterial mobilisation protein (MobC)